MWFKLASATFSTHLGSMSSLSNSISIKYTASGFSYTATSVTKTASSASLVLNLMNGWTCASTPTVSVTGAAKVSGTPTWSSNKLTINIAPSSGSNFAAGGSIINVSVTGATSSGGSGDVALTLADYKSYLGCIAGSTNTIQGTGTAGTTDEDNMYVQIPLQDFSNPSSVTITAGTSTKAYFAFFSRKVISDDNGQTPPYASGITAQTILSEGASSTATIPSGATHMYILLTNGTGGSLRPASVIFHNATFISNSDPASSSGGGTSGGTQTTEKVFDVFWTLGYTINSAGTLGAQPTYAVSDIITVPSGKKLKYTPYSGEQIWMVVGLWNGDTWIERKTFDPATVTSATTIDLGTATKIRIGYGRTSSSNIDMDLTTLKKLQLAWV